MLQGVSLYCAKSTRWCDDNKRHICKPFIYPHDSFLNWPKRFSGHFSSERNIIFASKTHFVSFFYKKFRVCFVWQENTPFPSHIINFGNDIQNVYTNLYMRILWNAINFQSKTKMIHENEIVKALRSWARTTYAKTMGEYTGRKMVQMRKMM